jgi:hypothetical protein
MGLARRFEGRRLLSVALALVVSSAWTIISPEAASGNYQSIYSKTRKIPEPLNCEGNILHLDHANYEAGKNGLIIVIARLGVGEEARPELNRHRLFNVRTYLTKYTTGPRADETIVTAEGDPAPGLARIELYVKGELYDVLTVRPGRELLVGNCDDRDESERVFYPWRKDPKP